MTVDLSLGTADAYVQETGSFDLAADAEIYGRFYFWFGAQNTAGNVRLAPVMANNDVFAIFQLWSGASTVEATIGIEYTTASGYRLFANETAAAAGATFAGLGLNEWHLVEFKAVIDDGVGNDGTLEVWLDGSALTAITALDQGAITSAVFGAIGIDAGTTRGWLAFDEIAADDARIYGYAERFPQTTMMRASGHAFVGPGTIDNISLLSGAGTDNVVSVYDTDEAELNDATRVPVELKNTANNELVDPAGMPIRVQRGAYVQMTGTNPRSIVKVCNAPIYGSDGVMRSYAARRAKRVI
ncbi:MAG: hypothetical protein WA210_14340 [Burkholderiaceae bacterium]